MTRLGSVLAVLALAVTACGSQHPVSALQDGAAVPQTITRTGEPVPQSTRLVTTTTTKTGVRQGATTRAGGTTVSGGGATSGTAELARGAPIRIGAVGTLSGVGTGQRGTVVAVQAWAKWTNAHGGLNGHPVEVLTVDDHADAAQLRQALQELVEVQHVVAFVGNITLFTLSDGAVKYLQDHQVPMIGGDRLGSQWYSSPMMFPQASAYDAATWIHLLIIITAGGPNAKVGWLSCVEAAQCRDGDAQLQRYAEDHHVDVRYHAQVSQQQVDFSVECQQAKRAGVQYFALALDLNSVRRVADDCATQGFHPVYETPQTAQSMAKQQELQGTLFASATFPWVSSSTPAMRAFHQALDAYAPDLE
ncbi:MAG: ABC transporter substrate-binding protein, partial [Actinomycetota bacterium]|nr:ABC transporter substrate-binding protein [Actinomycetota bacterium]